MAKSNLTYVDITKNPQRLKTVVCVTDQFNCDRIIKSAKVISDLTSSDLSVINVSSPNRYQDPASIEYLFKVSAENGGDMTVLYHDDPTKAMVNYIKSNKIANVISGMPESKNSVLHAIWGKFTHINFFTVNSSGELTEITNPAKAAKEIDPSKEATLATSF